MLRLEKTTSQMQVRLLLRRDVKTVRRRLPLKTYEANWPERHSLSSRSPSTGIASAVTANSVRPSFTSRLQAAVAVILVPNRVPRRVHANRTGAPRLFQIVRCKIACRHSPGGTSWASSQAEHTSGSLGAILLHQKCKLRTTTKFPKRRETSIPKRGDDLCQKHRRTYI